MEKQKEEKKRIRREYAKRGDTNQKMISFRADFATIRALEKVRNKGRLLNDLVRAWATKRAYLGEEIPPSEYDIEEYFT